MATIVDTRTDEAPLATRPASPGRLAIADRSPFRDRTSLWARTPDRDCQVFDNLLSTAFSQELILEDKTQHASSPAGSELRTVGDVRTLRALTHPVRIALIEALNMEGPLTATQAGELIGESATTCSFHLRQLAKYGMVEEAGGGRGRARPWQMSAVGLRIEPGEDTASQLAADALAALFREKHLDRYRGWLQARSSYPRRWQRAAVQSEYLFYLTIDEMEALQEELHQLLMDRGRERLADPSTRPAGSVPIELLLFSYPIASAPDPA